MMTDFKHLDEMLNAFSQLLNDTSWPESNHGCFLDYMVGDVYETSYAIREEAAAGRWTVALLLMRPLQERVEYALAAAIDASFEETYMKHIKTQIEKQFSGKSRQLDGLARGIINKWEKAADGMTDLLEHGKAFRKTGSEVLYHGMGFSREHEELVKARPAMLETLTGRVQLAIINVLAAIKIVGEDDTKAWRECQNIVSPSK